MSKFYNILFYYIYVDYILNYVTNIIINET